MGECIWRELPPPCFSEASRRSDRTQYVGLSALPPISTPKICVPDLTKSAKRETVTEVDQTRNRHGYITSWAGT
jgi:hypothetical protein